MCNSKCYDTISIIVSLVLGVIFAILVFCFPSLFFLGILFGFLLSIAALFLLTITASSLLRQDKRLNDCICATGKRLLIPALLLLAAAMIAFIFLTLCIATFITYPILTFILYTLITYTFFSLYCFLAASSKRAATTAAARNNIRFQTQNRPRPSGRGLSAFLYRERLPCHSVFLRRVRFFSTGAAAPLSGLGSMGRRY